jgi:polar amino acid transport system permease protein
MDVLIREAVPLLEGALATIEMLIGLLSLGLVLGMVFATVRVYGNRHLALIINFIEQVLRAVPTLVMLLIAYFSLAKYEISPILIAILTMGIRSAAYQSQIFRGAIQAIDTSQMETAEAMGMTKLQSIWHVLLPQIIRFSIGAWTNEYSTETKLVSLAYTVGVIDVLRRARYIVQYTYGNELLIYCNVALFYFILNRAGTTLLYALENRLYVPGFKKRGN